MSTPMSGDAGDAVRDDAVDLEAADAWMAQARTLVLDAMTLRDGAQGGTTDLARLLLDAGTAAGRLA